MLDIGLRPEDNARNIARAKAESIAPDFPDCWVIGADTLVTLDNEIFQKPEDEKDAERILNRLQGREVQLESLQILLNNKENHFDDL